MVNQEEIFHEGLEQLGVLYLGEVGPDVYVGIDPGTTGAIAFIRGKDAVVLDIPVSVVRKKSGKGHQSLYDYQQIARILGVVSGGQCVTMVTIEEGQKMLVIGGRVIGRPATSYACGWATGMWLPLLAYCDIPYELVLPGAWKKAMRLTNDKERSRLTARSMWPKAELSLKKHHNRAEALLLAEYGRRRHEGLLTQGSEKCGSPKRTKQP